MRLRFRTTRLRVLLLAATLLAGQWLLTQHLAQVEVHATDEPCEWCLTHAPLAGALPAMAAVPAAPVAHGKPIARIAAVPAAGFRLVYASRAPPRLLAV